MARRSFGSIRKLPSGRYQASHLHPDGTGRRVYAPETYRLKSEAARWLNAADTDLGRGTWAPPAPKRAAITFTEYASKWLDRRAAGLKPRTVAEYRRILAALEPTFGAVALHAIDGPMVRSWHADACPGRPSERAARYGLLRTVLAAAVADDLIPANPCTIRGGSRVKRARTITRISDAELAAITAAMPARWALMVQLGVFTGLRFGELAALRREDVDTAAGVIHVRRAVSVIDGVTVIHTPKSDAGARTVTIPPHIRADVAAHLMVYSGPVLLFTAATSPTAHVSHGTITKAFARACTAAGRPGQWHRRHRPAQPGPGGLVGGSDPLLRRLQPGLRAGGRRGEPLAGCGFRG